MDKLPQSELGSLLSSCLSVWGWEEWGTAKQRQSLWASGTWRKQASPLRLEICCRMEKSDEAQSKPPWNVRVRPKVKMCPCLLYVLLEPWNKYYIALSPKLNGGSDGKVSTCSVGDPGSIPGLGRSPGEGNGNPLQYSCLENSMDWGAR